MFLCYNAVSYTHLDVYKRQAYAISNEAEFIQKVRAASEVQQAQAAKDLKRKLNKDRRRCGEQMCIRDR